MFARCGSMKLHNTKQHVYSIGLRSPIAVALVGTLFGGFGGSRGKQMDAISSERRIVLPKN